MSSETDVAAVLNQIREEAAGGRLDAAESQCRELLMIAPWEPEAWSWLGLLLTARGDAAGAEAALRQALSLAADNANYWNYLSVAIRGQGRAAEAEDAARKAIAIDPRHATYWANLGAAVADQQRWLEAGAAYREAIGRQAGDAAAWQALASAESAAGRPNEAREAFERSLAIAPGSDATIGYALLLGQQQEVERAISLLEDYLMRNERAGLGWAVLSELRKNAGDIEGAEAACRRAVASGGVKHLGPQQPAIRDAVLPGLRRGRDRRGTPPLERTARQAAGGAGLAHANERTANRRLKIGYVSPNFRNHVLSFLTTPLLTAHDRSQVEVFCYSDVASPDPITDHLRSLADAWLDIKGLTDPDAADLVRHDSIDILVDITLHMEHNRLLMFARRPAPVQVTWLGYPGTTGMSAIDYRLSDPRLDPPGLFDGCYAEETVRLPDTFWCYDALGEEPAVK